MKFAIYFAGSIQKGHETNNSYWTEEDFNVLRERLSPLELVVLNPAERTDDLTDQHSVFGRDMTQVFLSDLVFFDARHRRGLGVGAEMMWAKTGGKPVLTWAPLETHYHKTNTTLLGKAVPYFVHPFVENLSDQVVSSLEEGASWILKFLEGNVGSIKDLGSIKEAMQYYLRKGLPRDEPMKQLVSSCENFKGKLSQTDLVLN